LLARIEEAIKKKTLRVKSSSLNSVRYKIVWIILQCGKKEVLSLIVRGHSNKEMARMLDISNRTIEAHRASIMEKMHANSLAELMMMVTHLEILNDNLHKN